MRIALTIDVVGARRGGAEKYAGAIARGWSAAGHEVHVFARSHEPGELPAPIVFHPVNPWNLPGLGWLKTYRFASASARAIEQAAKQTPFDMTVGFVKTWKQDVYIAVGGAHPAGVEASLVRHRSPIAKWLHRAAKMISPKQWVFRAIEQKQFTPANCPLVVAPSQRVKQEFQQWHQVPADKIVVVPNGVSAPSKSGDRARFRTRYDLREYHTAFLFIARNYELKGLEPLLHAFARVAAKRPHLRLICCGSQRDAEFKALASSLNIAERVMFLGYVDSIEDAFAGSDVFAFPTFYDPCSLVVPEAMQYGLPVVTTSNNGASDFIESGVDGFVVDHPWALDQLTTVLTALTDRQLRREVGARALEKAPSLRIERRLEELTDAIMAKRPREKTSTVHKAPHTAPAKKAHARAKRVA